MKQENTYKARLIKQIRLDEPDWLATSHQDVRTGGISDISVIGNHLTSWWELKHATPHFTTKGNQEYLSLQRAVQGFCRYIIYSEDKFGLNKRTLIVHPREVLGKKGYVDQMIPETWCKGYNQRWIVGYIRQVHGVKRTS